MNSIIRLQNWTTIEYLVTKISFLDLKIKYSNFEGNV
jgi:hypothetical protein